MAQPAPQKGNPDPKSIALQVAELLDSKRGEEIVIVEVVKYLPITSYFVICSGSSTRVLQSLAEAAKVILDKSGLPRLGIDGNRDARWVCMDYSEVVVHLFHNEARPFYDLDHLWADAPRIPFEPKGPSAETLAEEAAAAEDEWDDEY